MVIKGKLIDIPARRIFPAELTIADKKILQFGNWIGRFNCTRSILFALDLLMHMYILKVPCLCLLNLPGLLLCMEQLQR